MVVLTEEEVLVQVQEMIRYGVPSALIEIIAMLGFCDVVKQHQERLCRQHCILMLNTFIRACMCASDQLTCNSIMTRAPDLHLQCYCERIFAGIAN
jgi:hypothetical protein